MGSAARLERAEIPRTRNAHPASPPPLPPPSKHLKSSMKTIARSGALRATAGGVLVVLLLLGSSTKTALAFSSESEGAVEVKKVEVSTAADLAQVAKDISPDGKLKGIDLKISGDDFTDLTPLAGLKSVPGLSISDTDKLESLDALENLENVDLSLVIEDNEKLKSASLPKLSNVGMSLTIEDNEALASISLPELGSVGMDFEIEENEALKEVAAKVGSVGMSLTIEAEELASLDGLQVGSVGMDFTIDAPKVTEVPASLQGVAGMGVKLNGNAAQPAAGFPSGGQAASPFGPGFPFGSDSADSPDAIADAPEPEVPAIGDDANATDPSTGMP